MGNFTRFIKGGDYKMEQNKPTIKSDEIFLTPKQVREIENECGITPASCTPRIIGQGVEIDTEGNFVREYDELSCDSCLEVDCIWWVNAHSEEEKEQVRKWIEEEQEYSKSITEESEV